MCQRYLLLSPLPLLVLLMGCGDRSRSFSPLSPGEKWTYQVSSGSTIGTGGQGKVTITNLPNRELAGKAVTPEKYEANGQTFFVFVGEDSDGVFDLAEQAPNATEPALKKPPIYLLRRPYQEGTKWEQRSETQTLSTKVPITLQVSIESANDTITVPAGTLEGCLKVVGKGDQTQNMGAFMGRARIHVEETSWYCPGVGLAKTVRKETSNHLMAGSGEASIQLESHSRD
jgi:hypothetical protein